MTLAKVKEQDGMMLAKVKEQDGMVVASRVSIFHSFFVNDCVLQQNECSLQPIETHLPRGEIVYPGDL